MPRTVVDINGFTKVGGVQSIPDDRFNITGSSDVTKRVRFEVDGLTTGATRTIIPPDADIEIQGTHDVITTNWAARNHGAYTVIASATATDPGTPAAGHEFTTLVRNGTLTTSRGSYAVSGTLVRSVWHSGSWTDYPYGPLNAANTWTAAQTFSATARFNAAEGIALGMAAVAGNGVLQLASGTGKSAGWSQGSDIFGHRAGSNHFRFDLGGTPILEIYTTSNTVPVLRFTQNGTSDRCSIGANGTVMEFRHNGGTLNMSMSETTWGVFGNRISKPTISGSRGGNAALASLLTNLALYGLITDSTTA